MPADVAVRPPTNLLGPGPSSALPSNPEPLPWSAEERSGRLTLVGAGGARQEVLVRVYRTSLEHFAVLYPGHKKLCPQPLGVLSLRNTRVCALEDGRVGFVVRQRAPDAPHALTFVLEEASEASEACALEAWVRSFTWRGSPTMHASPLPAVAEDEDEA